MTARAGVLAAVAAAVVLGALFVGGARLVSSPGFVDRISIVNGSEFEVLVQVRGAENSAWLNAGSISPESTGRFDEIIDQGSTWTFRFTVQGVVGGELEMTRATLKSSGWTLRIPEHVVARLRAHEAPALE